MMQLPTLCSLLLFNLIVRAISSGMGGEKDFLQGLGRGRSVKFPRDEIDPIAFDNRPEQGWNKSEKNNRDRRTDVASEISP